MRKRSSVAVIALILMGLIAGSARYLFSAPSDLSRERLAPSSPRKAHPIAMQTTTMAVDSSHVRSVSPLPSETAWTIAGLVRTTRGAALSTATICVVDKGHSTVERCIGVDAAGEYAFTGVPPGVRALLASAPGHRSRIEPVSAPRRKQSSVQNIVIALEPSNSGVRGIVADATGGFVPGALVTAHAMPAQDVLGVALSGPDGRFELNLPEGKVELRAEAEAYAPAVKNVVAPAAGLTLTLIPGSEIVGRVVALDSRAPVADVLVQARNAGDMMAISGSGRSGQDGTFRLVALVAGRYQVEAIGAEWRSDPLSIALGVGQISDEITLSVSPATSLDAIVQVGGEPCAHAYLHLSGPRSSIEQAQASGAIRIEGLPPGQYLVTGGCPGQSRMQIAEDLRVGSEPVTRVWNLEPEEDVREPADCCEPSGTIHVVVDSEEGGAGGLLTVWAAVSNQPRANLPGRVQGDTTVFKKLSLGRYDVYLDQSPKTRAQVSLERDGQVEEVRLRVPQRTRISGNVLDERGIPIPDAWVRAVNQQGRVNEAAVVPVLSDAEGSFTISGLFPTRYEVTVESPVGSARLDSVPGNSQNIVLRVKPHGSLSGQITSPFGSGEPVFVYCRRSGDNEVHFTTGSPSWQLPWIPVGVYEVFAVADSGFASSNVTIEAGDTAEVSLMLQPKEHDELPAWVRGAPPPRQSGVDRSAMTTEIERSGEQTDVQSGGTRERE